MAWRRPGDKPLSEPVMENLLKHICVTRPQWVNRLSQEDSLWHCTGHSWWRHQMETISALLTLCAGNSPVPVNSPHKGQWRGALMFSLIYTWINDWVNKRETGDLRRHRGHYDVIVMYIKTTATSRTGSWFKLTLHKLTWKQLYQTYSVYFNNVIHVIFLWGDILKWRK